MEIRKMLVAVVCSLFRCEHEYPSDPLQGQRSVNTGIGDRSGRDYNFNDIDKSDYPIVKTSSGFLEGYRMSTIKGRSIAAFEGILYAEDTGGKNRFHPPIPKRSWTGVRQAKSPTEKCLQLHVVHVMQLVGSEDCLSLNIYTPQVPTKRKRPNYPVLVFIHGGSWYFGAGSEYGPAYLLEHDVILVTVNYRLGVLGFLSTGDEVLPGNNGLKDQSLALTWIHKNIKAFGGNPSEITIAGQSSGAASVHLHMMSPLSRGKFSKAISISGNAYSSWAIMSPKTLKYRSQKVARAANCPEKPSQAFVSCLKKIRGSMLAKMLLFTFDLPLLPPVPLGAVIERNVTGAFLTASPDELYAQNEVAKVPWINARNSNESQALFTLFGLLGFRRENVITRPIWRIFAPILQDYRLSADNPNEITDKANSFYTKENKFATNGSLYSAMTEDRVFGYGVHKGLQLHSQLAPTFSWIYSYQAQASILGLLGADPKNHGVTHTDDLSIYFNMSEYYPGYRTTDPEWAMVKLMTSLIATFVSTGEPSYVDENGTKLITIDVIKDPRNIRVLSINEEVKMIPEPNLERYKFWESLGLSDMKPFIPIT